MNPISELQSPDELKHGLAPIWTAARIANPEFAAGGRVTFPDAPVFGIAAESWKQSLFLPILRPALLKALDLARQGKAREIQEADVRLSSALPAFAIDGSLRAGRRLAANSSDLRGDRALRRALDGIAGGAMHGHLVSIFALRCAVFSIFDRAALGAYLFQELVGGAPGTPVSEICDFLSSCLEPFESRELRAA